MHHSSNGLVLKLLDVKFEDVRAGLGDGFEPVDSQPGEIQHLGAESTGPEADTRARNDLARASQADVDLDRRFRWALALYSFLGLLVWFTMGAGKVLVEGKPVELRLVPLIVIGGLALRTVVAHRAEKIRRGG